MRLKYLPHLISCLIFLTGAASCSMDYYKGEKSQPEGFLQLNMKAPASSSTNTNDMRLLLSSRGGVDDGKFSYETYNITHTSTTLTSVIKTGNWYLTLVSPQGATLKNPVAGQPMASQLMYEYSPTIWNNESSIAHQFYFGRSALPEIVEDGTHSVNNIGFARNVAKVEVSVDRVRNIDPDAVQHVRLYYVPSQISWTGELLPSKDAPATLSAPLERIMKFHQRDNGDYYSEILSFIVPAHRGNDFWNPDGSFNKTPMDVTTKKMDIEIEFTDKSGSVVKIRKTLPSVVRCNQIMQVKLVLNSLNLTLDCDYTTMPTWDEVVSQGGDLN